MQDKDYLLRCLDLAKLGGKSVRPNPLVGAVIVNGNRIIGEGYHKKYGGPHAEVNAIRSVQKEDMHLLSKSTIYVSLEPCCHTGNTPPCTELIIHHKIPRVCIAEIDPTEKVNNKGIAKLKAHGIQVDIIRIQNNNLLDVFKVNQLKKRPFVQLKFAKSADHFIGSNDKQVWLSNDTTNVFTHKLRSNTDAILIGTNTALIDNPSLTLRNYPGASPQRVVLDRLGRIPVTHTLLSDDNPCILITENKRELKLTNKQQVIFNFSDDSFLENVLSYLFQLNINHVMVEGGGALLASFIKAELWDEAVVIQTEKHLNEGVKAPNLSGKIKSSYILENDRVFVIENACKKR